MMKDEVLTLIKELEEKKKDFENCVSTEEVLFIREWNRAIDECVNVVVKKYV